ncbi:MAG: hypothetical protein IMF04_03730 [Proteobacteria bacterium]|nr:hypothetical protein [Pseudomonadota bacterium]
MLITKPQEPEIVVRMDIKGISWDEQKTAVFETLSADNVAATPHADDKIQHIIEQLLLPEAATQEGIALTDLIATFIVKHPCFDIASADIDLLNSKVGEYDLWLEEVQEMYIDEEVDLSHDALALWIHDFINDTAFQSYVYSLALSNDELQFGDVEEAIDIAIMGFFNQTEDISDEFMYAEETYYDSLYQYQEDFELALQQLWRTTGLFGIFLLIVLLFRIEEKLS